MTLKQSLFMTAIAVCVVLLSIFSHQRIHVRTEALNSALARVSSLQYNLVNMRNTSRPSSKYLTPDNFREYFIFEFENLKHDIASVGLDANPAWIKFADSWEKIRNSQNVYRNRLEFADNANALTSALHSRVATVRRPIWFANFLLIGGLCIGLFLFGQILWRDGKLINSKKSSLFPNKEKKPAQNLEVLKNLDFYRHAMKEPLESLRMGMQQIELSLTSSERALAIPVEATLFDNPLYFENAEQSRRHLEEARRIVHTLLGSQSRLEELSEILNPEKQQLNSISLVKVSELLQSSLETVTLQADDAGVILDVTMRCDDIEILVDARVLTYCIQRLALESICTAQGSLKADRRVIVSVWDGPQFWSRYALLDVVSEDDMQKFSISPEPTLNDKAIVILVADSGDVVEHHDEEGKITNEKYMLSEDLAFVENTVKKQGGFFVRSKINAEPDYPGRQWIVYWPLLES